jgi:DNA-directed RNA polymerase III subunit RPC7
MSRGGRGGGARGGGQRSAPGTVMIAGTEMAWDLTGLELQKGPGDLFPVS